MRGGWDTSARTTFNDLRREAYEHECSICAQMAEQHQTGDLLSFATQTRAALVKLLTPIHNT